MVSVDSNLHPLSDFLMWEQTEFPRSKIWRAWRIRKDFPVSVLQLSLDVTMAMKCHIVLKLTACFSSYCCFDKGKVTHYHATVEHNTHHWLKFQVELYGPTQHVIHYFQSALTFSYNYFCGNIKEWLSTLSNFNLAWYVCIHDSSTFKMQERYTAPSLHDHWISAVANSTCLACHSFSMCGIQFAQTFLCSICLVGMQNLLQTSPLLIQLLCTSCHSFLSAQHKHNPRLSTVLVADMPLKGASHASFHISQMALINQRMILYNRAQMPSPPLKRS